MPVLLGAVMMMAPEYTPMDARRAAIEDLYRAITDLECGDTNASERHALSAVAWIRDIK